MGTLLVKVRFWTLLAHSLPSDENVRSPQKRRTDAPMPSLEGVYRYRRLVNGCRAWYALNAAGEMLAPALRVVGAGESEASVVAELRETMIAARRAASMRVVQGGAEHVEHSLTPRPAAASLSIDSFVRLLRVQQPA